MGPAADPAGREGTGRGRRLRASPVGGFGTGNVPAGAAKGRREEGPSQSLPGQSQSLSLSFCMPPSGGGRLEPGFAIRLGSLGTETM